jgi:TonB-dependent receptor
MLASTILATLSSAQAAAGQEAVKTAAAESAATNDIVVTAPRDADKARTTQRDAAVLVNVQSAEAIRKNPDYNAAEALSRIPGISLSSDTGEGRFVNIRGIDANLNGATYGGVVLLNTFPAGTAASGSGRAVEFDTVPTGAIDGIVVYKTLSPDREAEGLGGQIDLTPRTSKDITKSFIEGELSAGYEPLHKNGGPYSASVAAGAKFGAFSVIVTGSRKDDQRGVDDTEPSYVKDLGTSNVILGRTDFRRYDYSRRRFGYGGEIDFKPSDDHSFFLRGDIAGYIERSHKDHFYAGFDGNPSAPDAQGYVVDRFKPQVDIVDLQETHRNTVLAAGGDDKIGGFEVDYRAAYSRATYNEGYYYEARFVGPDSFYGRYNTSNPKRFQYQFFNDAALTQPFISTNVTQYNSSPTSTRLSRFSEQDVDQEYSGVFNIKHSLDLFDGEGSFKAGVSIRKRDKVVNDFAGFGGSALNLSAVAKPVGPSSQYYFGRYPVAPLANFQAVDDYVQANVPLAPSLGRDFRDKENVYAAYAMYTGTFGKLGVLTGARIERTEATYGNFLTSTDANGDTTTFVTNKKTYTNVFPTLQFKYAIMPNLQVRATYSTGIARPGFSQAGGFAGVDFTATPRPQFTAGNPNLKPTTGNNFDLDVEYYLPNGGIIQIGAFDKEFKNYIFKSALINVASPIFSSGGFASGDFITYVNEDAYARGIEVAYQQKFHSLPGLLGGLGLEGNFTFVDSRFREYGAAVSANQQDQYGPLPGTSRYTGNLAGFYERDGIQLRLAAQYVSSSLFALQGDQSVDTIQAARLTMDTSGSYELSNNFTLFYQVKNLLNTPLRYNDGYSYRPQQTEYYGQTYEAGVRFKF